MKLCALCGSSKTYACVEIENATVGQLIQTFSTWNEPQETPAPIQFEAESVADEYDWDDNYDWDDFDDSYIVAEVPEVVGYENFADLLGGAVKLSEAETVYEGTAIEVEYVVNNLAERVR